MLDLPVVGQELSETHLLEGKDLSEAHRLVLEVGWITLISLFVLPPLKYLFWPLMIFLSLGAGFLCFVTPLVIFPVKDFAVFFLPLGA